MVFTSLLIYSNSDYLKVGIAQLWNDVIGLIGLQFHYVIDGEVGE